MLIHSIATRLVQEIQHSPIGTITDLVEVLLSSKNLALQTSVAPMKTKDTTQCILNALLAHACRETIIEWAIEQACGRFRSEIFQVSRVESGLHFNTSHAQATNILNFNLEEIAQTLESIAPCTWHMVQCLLDSNPVAHRSKVANKSSDYENHHDVIKESLGDASNAGRSGGSEGRMEGIIEDKGDKGIEGDRGEEGMKHLAGDQADALL